MPKNPKHRSPREEAILLHRVLDRQEAEHYNYVRACGAQKPANFSAEWNRLLDKAHATRMRLAALNQRLGQGMAETTRMTHAAGYRPNPVDDYARRTAKSWVVMSVTRAGREITHWRGPDKAEAYAYAEQVKTRLRAGGKASQASTVHVMPLATNPRASSPSDRVKAVKALVPKDYFVKEGTGSLRGKLSVYRPPDHDHLEWARVSRKLRSVFPGTDFSGLAPESFCHYWLDMNPAQRAADDERRAGDQRKFAASHPLRFMPQADVDRALGIKRNPGQSPKATAAALVKRAESYLGMGDAQKAKDALVEAYPLIDRAYPAKWAAGLLTHTSYLRLRLERLGVTVERTTPTGGWKSARQGACSNPGCAFRKNPSRVTLQQGSNGNWTGTYNGVVTASGASSLDVLKRDMVEYLVGRGYSRVAAREEVGEAAVYRKNTQRIA